jgi:hypothetical protein
MATYLTKQGDEWDRIAFKQLGSEHLVDRLIAINSEHRMTVVFSAGIRLILPEVKTNPRTFGPAPWRKVIRVSSPQSVFGA